MELEIKAIGSLEITYRGAPQKLPASLKTRTLLAYLVISGGTHSRQGLCDLLWDTPDDPRAALRWSLTKLRPIINAGGIERLGADRKAVWLEPREIISDRDQLSLALMNSACTETEAEAVWELVEGVMLEDCELPNQSNYMIWLEGQRDALSRSKSRLCQRFAEDAEITPLTRTKWAERWLREEPFSQEGARCAVEAKRAAVGKVAATNLAKKLTQHFRDAEIEPPVLLGTSVTVESAPALPTPTQRIRFVKTSGGVSLAWASVGDDKSPPLVKAANWLNHLELDWNAPIWSPLFRELAQSYHFIRYDERGCGLSDWDLAEITFEKFVDDLKQVVDAARLDQFPLLGISQGAAVSIEFAARYPERVSKLILFGAYDCGWRHTAKSDEVSEREAVMVLTGTGWGSDNPVYRHLFSRTFMPDANAEELEWFDEFQRTTTSPKNAVRFLEAFSTIDVRDRLAEIQCPTLVVHSRGDLRIPFTTGRSMASRIPNAQLAGIDSNNHLLLGREAASVEFVDLVRNFLKSD